LRRHCGIGRVRIHALLLLAAMLSSVAALGCGSTSSSVQSTPVANETPTVSKWVPYDAGESGFSIKFPSPLLRRVTDSDALQPFRDVSPGASVHGFQSIDGRYLFVVVARPEEVTAQIRNAEKAVYEHAAEVMAKALKTGMQGAKDVTAKSGRLGGLNGTFVSYSKGGEGGAEYKFVSWYHLYGRGMVFDVFASRPLVDLSPNADSLPKVLQSFHATD